MYYFQNLLERFISELPCAVVVRTLTNIEI
jgi:hypothetical protein